MVPDLHLGFKMLMSVCFGSEQCVKAKTRSSDTSNPLLLTVPPLRATNVVIWCVKLLRASLHKGICYNGGLLMIWDNINMQVKNKYKGQHDARPMFSLEFPLVTLSRHCSLKRVCQTLRHTTFWCSLKIKGIDCRVATCTHRSLTQNPQVELNVLNHQCHGLNW